MTYGASPSANTYSFEEHDIDTGQIPLISEPITILSGQVLPRGAVLGKITATGKYVLSLAAANDGSQVPGPVLTHDVDATGGDAKSAGYVHGQFIAPALTYGAGHSAATVKAAWAADTNNLHLVSAS